jgi:hypothetical protein
MCFHSLSVKQKSFKSNVLFQRSVVDHVIIRFYFTFIPKQGICRTYYLLSIINKSLHIHN